MLIDAPFNEITNAILGAAIEVHRVHRAQVLTYMKLTNCPAGLLINFNVPRLMDGVRRLVLPGYETAIGGSHS
jgi:hypothetical protein